MSSSQNVFLALVGICTLGKWMWPRHLYSDWILWGRLGEDDAFCYAIVVLISRSVALGKLSEF